VAEAFQMVAEGLSNIRKHTKAVHVRVRVVCGSDI
jgi:signal transduction histidine kinase